MQAFDLTILFDRLDEFGSKKLINGPNILTYGELSQRCKQIYEFLTAKGFAPGDRIGIAATDETEACALILTCLRIGMPVALIDTGAKKSEALQIIGKLKLKALFIDPALSEEWSPDVPYIWVLKRQKAKLISRLLGKKEMDAGRERDYPECLQSLNGNKDLPPAPKSDSIGLLLCTSGTTGLPKILQLSIGNLMAAARTTSTKLGFDSDIRVLNLLPLTHYDGSISGLFTTFCNMATLIRPGPFTVALLPEVFDAIHRHQATHLLITPSILGLMLRLGEEIRDSFDADSFRFVISVAATLPAKLWSDFQEITAKKIINVYGLSETGNNLFAGPDDDSYKIGSIGKPVDCRAAIINDKDEIVKDGEMGELLLEGASITSGYLGEPVVTKFIDGVNWFATGDLARIDAEGVYWLAGRKKTIIIVGGRNVYPDEINNVLLSHPAVMEAATLGLSDAIWGERVVSCVVPKSGVTADELLGFAGAHLSEYKVPREIHVLNELPKGRSGKILLNELAERLRSGAVPQSESGHIELEQQVLRAAAESFRLPVSELSMKTAPANCRRWDSVAHMDFVTNMESKFGVELQPREVIQITTLEGAVRIVRSKLEAIRTASK